MHEVVGVEVPLSVKALYPDEMGEGVGAKDRLDNV